MKLYEYVYRNRKLDCGSNPIYLSTDPEHTKIGVQRELLRLTDEKKIKEMADLEFVYIGTFDDVTLKHEQLGGSELLVTCGDYLLKPEE